MHVAFIIDNSPTMQQKGCNNLSLIDYAKGSIQNTVKNISRSGFPGTNDFIHLFKTSQPKQPISSFQHQSLHFNYQLKTIQCEFPTYPTQTLVQVYKHISKFRILNSCQTMEGYRQGQIYQPALIVFLTDKMTKRHILRLFEAVKQSKFQVRSQYQFLICRICPPAPSQKNVNTYDIFKKEIQTQQETALLIKFAQSLNGDMKLLFNYEQLTQAMTSAIQNFKPSLCVELANRQLPIFQNCFKISKVGSMLAKQLNQRTFRIWMYSLNKKCRIPLPYKITSKQENHEPEIEKAYFLKFYIDLSKTLASSFSSACPVQRYKVNPNQLLWNISKSAQFQKQERYPVFYTYQDRDTQLLQQYPNVLIGLLYVTSTGVFQLQIFPPNFIAFDSILMMIQQKSSYKTIEPLLNNYASILPSFYFSYVKQFLMKIYNLKISQQVSNNNNLQNFQYKIEQYYSVQKKRLIQQRRNNALLHSNNRSQCCLIYSSKYNSFNKTINGTKGKSIVQNTFTATLSALLDLKSRFQINDYITNQKESTPMTKQLEKYAGRKGQEFDQNVNASSFGNPFKKKRKNNQTSAQLKQQGMIDKGKLGQNQQVKNNEAVFQQLQDINTVQEQKLFIPVAENSHIQFEVKEQVQNNLYAVVDEQLNQEIDVKIKVQKKRRMINTPKIVKQIIVQQMSLPILDEFKKFQTQDCQKVQFSIVNINIEAYLRNKEIISKIKALRDQKTNLL